MKKSNQFLLALLMVPLLSLSSSFAETAIDPASGLYRSVTQREDEIVSRTAVMALRAIVQARADIHQGKLEMARQDLDEARRLMMTIRTNLSTAVAKERIWVAGKHLEYETVPRVLKDFPPIYSALHGIEEYFPTDKARRHIDNAKRYLEKGEKKGAQRELNLAAGELVVVEVELPLAKAEKSVEKAGEYLARNEGTKADEALKIAEEKVQALSAESPLRGALKSFWQASRSYAAGKSAEARSFIEQGRVYLGQAAKTANTKGKEEVDKLSRSIAELERKVHKRENGVEAAFKSTWEKSKALAERDSEYLAARWEESETTLGAEDDLIEAKLHVSFAETYQITTSEPLKAAEELETASYYLGKAMKNTLVDKATQNEIGAIKKEIEALGNAPEKGGAALEERYDRIKDKLRGLLQLI